jgi:hypothetical protein
VLRKNGYIRVVWDATLCNPAENYWRLGNPAAFIFYPKTLVTFYKTHRRHIIQENNPTYFIAVINQLKLEQNFILWSWWQAFEMPTISLQTLWIWRTGVPRGMAKVSPGRAANDISISPPTCPVSVGFYDIPHLSGPPTSKIRGWLNQAWVGGGGLNSIYCVIHWSRRISLKQLVTSRW